MNNHQLIQMLHETNPEQNYDTNLIKGYSDQEIQKMERLYDVKITGELYEFLIFMGRCSGGFMGDYPLMFYRENRTIRSHFFAQAGIREVLQDLKMYEFFDEKSFLISIESETQYYFLLTKSENPNLVYHYDENTETVKATALTFNEYLKHIMKEIVPTYIVKDLVQRGEMIEI